jgi:F0F1-type ATP synthase membrane subunit b/b'
MEWYSVMKRDIFWLLICYTIIKCKSVFATNLNSNAGMDINWFKLGSEYIHSPALGWSLLTFLLFLFIVIYFSRLALIDLLHLRYNQTKSLIDSIRHEKISINKQLIHQSHQIKDLNKNLKKIVLRTYHKIKVYQEKNTNHINILKKQLSESLIKSVQNYIYTVKNNIKNKFVFTVINHASEKLSSSKPLFNNFDEKFQDKLKKILSSIDI